jgi:uncharacterized protein YjeT (DUF2065 family)
VQDFVAAVGLVLVIEGLLYGGFPSFARRVASEAANAPESQLRVAGLVAIAAGVFVVWLVRG